MVSSGGGGRMVVRGGMECVRHGRGATHSISAMFGENSLDDSDASQSVSEAKPADTHEVTSLVFTRAHVEVHYRIVSSRLRLD